VAEYPRRRVQVTVKLGADSWRDAADALVDISRRMDEAGLAGERNANMASGGTRSGYTMTGDEDESESDEGEIRIAVGVEKGKVVLHFGEPTMWIGMTPQQAADLAASRAPNAAELLAQSLPSSQAAGS
jgi:hypothetical protein